MMQQAPTKKMIKLTEILCSVSFCIFLITTPQPLTAHFYEEQETTIKLPLDELESERELLERNYFKRMHKLPDLDNPSTINEKIAWLKLYNRHPLHTLCSDKYLVREYIKEKIGEEYLIPLIGAYDSPAEIDFDSLPNEFVLKPNHAAELIIICKNKASLNQERAKERMEKWLHTDYHALSREWAYKDIPRKILCEKFMKDEKTDDLRDYKFYCFNGKPLYIQVTSKRFENSSTHVFDLEWERVELHKSLTTDKSTIPEKPSTFDTMERIAKTLSKGFKYIRIDLYEINGRVYFGEMSLYPCAGYGQFASYLHEYLFGKELNLHDPNCPY